MTETQDYMSFNVWRGISIYGLTFHAFIFFIFTSEHLQINVENLPLLLGMEENEYVS